MNSKISIVRDLEGNNIVLIHDILFKGKRSVKWDDVEEYLKQYVGDFFRIADSNDIVYIGSEFPSEYTGSIYTKRLKGAAAKAKANATQGLPELIETASFGSYEKNRKAKHKRDAKNGWYRYNAYFAIPVYDEHGELTRFNVFHASLLIRHASSGKRYLYDVTEIKKETSMSCQASALPGIEPISLTK
jgi:hypothetical protein